MTLCIGLSEKAKCECIMTKRAPAGVDKKHYWKFRIDGKVALALWVDFFPISFPAALSGRFSKKIHCMSENMQENTALWLNLSYTQCVFQTP